jgi:DNA-binding winged helix-turn-helix (wHTH) protein/tetratricopeptide (TPR) repeat protein
MRVPEPAILRFGAFELDRRSGELRRSGRRLHLTPQAFQLLALLVERAGALVTREEIRQALWSGGTFVEFDSAVNACVSQIRAALGDKPTSPRFVETLPRRGYRFVASVELVEPEKRPDAVAPAEPAISAPAPAQSTPTRWWSSGVLLFGSVALAVIVLVVTIALPRRGSVFNYVRGRSVEAVQKYERARSGLEDASPTELTDRVRFFNTAIGLSPDFAEAYAGLADAKLILGIYRVEPAPLAYAAAKAAAAKALSIDDQLGDAHAAYATAVLMLDWNWAEARSHFDQALSASPQSPRVHHWYARYLTALGRHDDARVHAQRAADATPTSPSASTYLGVAHFYAGDAPAARRNCQRALDLMPEFTPARYCLDAIDQPDAASAAMPDTFLQSAMQAVHAGDIPGALDTLQRAANRHSDALIYASVLPGLRKLRGEPRFNLILERVGLKAPEQATR